MDAAPAPASPPKASLSAGADGGFDAGDAAAALKALAAAAWNLGEDGDAEMDNGEASGGSWGSDGEDGRSSWRPPRRRAGGRRPGSRASDGGVGEGRGCAARRQRAAKLWCRHPRDASQWALVLSQSAIDSRNISLPWTNPGEPLRPTACCDLL
jgi:hypothetical protein